MARTDSGKSGHYDGYDVRLGRVLAEGSRPSFYKSRNDV